MLTLGPQPEGLSPAVFGYRLEIPNLVIRELQWEHLATLLRDEARMTIDTRDLETALQAMAVGGDIDPFLDLFHARVVKKAFKQAEEQVARYAGDERLVPLLTQGQALKAGTLVFVGAQKVVFRPWGTAKGARPPAR
jgi:hypothetical protein